MTVCQLISGRFRSRGNQKELCPRAGYGAGDNELMLLRAGEYTSKLAKRVEDRRPDLTMRPFLTHCQKALGQRSNGHQVS